MKKKEVSLIFTVVTVTIIVFGVIIGISKVASFGEDAVGKSVIDNLITLKKLDVKIDTPEYFNLLNDVLWGLYNNELQSTHCFKEAINYAAHYYSNPTILYPNGKERCKECENKVYQTSQVLNFTYNPTAAVSYAYQWAVEGGKAQNPSYPDFRNNGGDCTNFASQTVHAGSVPIDGNGTCSYYSTITKWYVNKAAWWCLQSNWAWSTSWSVVGDFYTYQTQYKNNANSTVYTVSQVNMLRQSALIGDIIQLETGGSKWHSLVVTKKQGGEIFLTYHSGPGGYDCVDHSLESIINSNTIDHLFLIHFR